MLQPQVISTESVPAHRRVAFWNELIGGALIAQVADPVEPRQFSGSIKSLQLGDIRIAEIRAHASRVRRTASHVAQTSERVWLMRVQLAGSVTAYYDRQEMRLEPGDFMLYDNTRPYEILFHKPAAMLALRISQDALLRYIGRPDHFACRVMPGLSGASGLASQVLQAFWQRCPEVHSDDVARRLLDVSLRLVADAYADASQLQMDQSCLRAAHRLRIYNYVDRHLKDPKLTPTSIASALRITPAYLHRILRAEPETASRYIMRRRLKECARALINPSSPAHNVTTLAFEYGFKSLAHFSRAFRDCYGVAPRTFRARHGKWVE